MATRNLLHAPYSQTYKHTGAVSATSASGGFQTETLPTWRAGASCKRLRPAERCPGGPGTRVQPAKRPGGTIAVGQHPRGENSESQALSGKIPKRARIKWVFESYAPDPEQFSLPYVCQHS